MINKQKISIKQLFFLVILTQVGVHILSIPYAESRYAGYDSWMSLLIGGIFAQAAILIIYQLGKRYADKPLPQYISAITGKPLGLVLNILFGAYCLESSLMVVISYSDVLNRWVLFKTPWSVLIALSVSIAAYIASSSLREMATITQTIVIIFLICFVIIIISGFGKGDFHHFLPVGSHGIKSILKDSLPSFWAYAGYELLLYVFPYVSYRKKKDIVIAMSFANGFTTFIYVLMSAIVLYNYSESQLNSIPEPMVFILRKFRWPIVQSLDILFMTLWLSVTTVTVYVYLFLSARYLAFVGNKEYRNHSFLVWILAFVCFVFGLWGRNRQWLSRFSDFHNTTTAIIIVIVPTFLLLISLARGRAAKE